VLQGAATLMQRTGVEGTVMVTIGGTGGDGPRALASAAGKGALAAMARGFAAALAAQRIRVFGLNLDDERSGQAAAPNDIARAIVELAAGNVSAPSGSIIELAQARTAGAVTA
jgi:NAD(P)-dependent dehydrogenase (short-subunit alcohol dehydrogenase family)